VISISPPPQRSFAHPSARGRGLLAATGQACHRRSRSTPDPCPATTACAREFGQHGIRVHVVRNLGPDRHGEIAVRAAASRRRESAHTRRAGAFVAGSKDGSQGGWVVRWVLAARRRIVRKDSPRFPAITTQLPRAVAIVPVCAIQIPCVVFSGLACTPATDLQQERAARRPRGHKRQLTSPDSGTLGGRAGRTALGSANLPTNLAPSVGALHRGQVQATGRGLCPSASDHRGDGLPLPLGAAVPCAGRCYEILLTACSNPRPLTLEARPERAVFPGWEADAWSHAGSFTTGAEGDPVRTATSRRFTVRGSLKVACRGTCRDQIGTR